MTVQAVEASSIEEAIYRAIRTVKPSLAGAELSPGTNLQELGLESLERAIVVFEIEDAYEIGLVDANLDRFKTIGEARDTVSRLLAAKNVNVNG